MTTPASEAIKGLVGVLREAADTDHQDFGKGVCQWCGHDVELCDEASGCVGWKMRAALSAFEGRARLRDDPKLVRIVRDTASTTTVGAMYILSAIESALLGTPGTGEEGERPSKEGKRP